MDRVNWLASEGGHIAVALLVLFAGLLVSVFCSRPDAVKAGTTMMEAAATALWLLFRMRGPDTAAS